MKEEKIYYYDTLFPIPVNNIKQKKLGKKTVSFEKL